MTRRGNPTSLSPDLAAEMERMWVHTHLHQDDIACRLNERFGATLEGRNVEWHARRRCWNRERISKAINHRSVVEERLATQSLGRSNRIPTVADPVRKVAAGAFPAVGFSMLGGRV